MRGDSRGIKQLLIAEKKADEKIENARKRKTARLKQAKDEVEAEIRRLKSEKEKDFKAYEEQYVGSKEDKAQLIEAETAKLLGDINTRVDAEKGKVIDYLLDQVLSITPKLHKNFNARDKQIVDHFPEKVH